MRKEGCAMLNWISQNLGTIVVGFVIAAIAAAIVVKIVRDKRKGKSAGCGCGCESCPKSSTRGTERRD